MAKEIIVGVHSIVAALNNPKRSGLELWAAEEGFDELHSRAQMSRKEAEKKCEIELCSPHKLQEIGKTLIEENSFTYSRIPSHLMLLAHPLIESDITNIYSSIDNGEPVKIILLDQVTDAHNAAAIMRTAAFYGVDYLVVSRRGSFGLSPSFYRIASGATEFIKLVNVPSLPKCLTKLKDKGLKVIGFSEHAEKEAEQLKTEENICLVLGAEDIGLSNAVKRNVDEYICLKSQGPIKSLNVSVASAVAMEKFWGKS